MKKKALLVIDMLKDFLEEAGSLYCGQASREIIPFIKEKIAQFRKDADKVIYVMDCHAPDDLEFRLFPKHCVKGTPGAELIDELKAEGRDVLIPKTTFDGAYGTSLEEVLKEHKIEEIYLVGVCTSICVMETAGSLSKLRYPVFIYKQGVADFDSQNHKFALKRMESLYGAKII